MIRRRWLRTAWPISMTILGQRLMKKSFSDDVRQGFIVDRLRTDRLEARFVERIDVLETIMDPLGRSSEYKITDFRQVSFVISEGIIGLEIRGTSKSYRPFVNALSEICDFDLSIDNILVDPLVWGSAIKNSSPEIYSLESAQLSDISISAGVKAKIVMQGSTDITQPLNDYVREKPHKVDKIKLQTASRQKTSIILSANGSASITGVENQDHFQMIRSCLQDVVGHKK